MGHGQFKVKKNVQPKRWVPGERTEIKVLLPLRKKAGAKMKLTRWTSREWRKKERTEQWNASMTMAQRERERERESEREENEFTAILTLPVERKYWQGANYLCSVKC